LRRLLRALGKIACLALGVGLDVGGCYSLWDQYRFGATAAHADGTVVGLKERTSDAATWSSENYHQIGGTLPKYTLTLR
jgi:hypothetical protein